MAVKIDRSLLKDPSYPSPELITFAIAQQQATVAELQKKSDYYDGKHDVFKRSKNADGQLTNVMINNAKYVTDINVGFMLGNPVSYAPGADSKIDDVLVELENMRVKKHDRELEKDLSVFGIGYELLYLKVRDDNPKDVELKIAVIDPRGIVLVTDDTVDSEPLFAVRYTPKFNLQGGADGYQVEVYTATTIIVFRVGNLADVAAYEEPIAIKENFYRDVPVVEYRNNEEKQGDFEQAISLMDAYNVLQSDRINDKEAFIDALLILYGFTLGSEEGDSDGEINGNMLEAPAKTDGVGAEWLTKTFDEKGVDILAKSIEENIHKVTYTPNLSDEKFGGNISGEAMKYKLFGLLQLLVTKTGYFEDGLLRRLKLIENMLRVKGKDVEIKGTKISFKVNLPVNKKDIIDMIRDSQEFIPMLVSLGWLPDIDDPQEVIDMMNEQKEKQIELNRKALGNNVKSPRVSLEELDDEEGEEGADKNEQG